MFAFELLNVEGVLFKSVFIWLFNFAFQLIVLNLQLLNFCLQSLNLHLERLRLFELTGRGHFDRLSWVNLLQVRQGVLKSGGVRSFLVKLRFILLSDLLYFGTETLRHFLGAALE